MGYTTFADVKFDPNLWMEYIEEADTRKNALVMSGVIRQDGAIQTRIQEGSTLITVPSFKPLTGASQVYDGTDITINSIASTTQSAIIIRRANAWGSQDLAAELATADPIKVIAGKVAQYWESDKQTTLIQVLKGVFGVAGMSSHISNVAIEDGNAATDSSLISESLIVDTAQKALGDNSDKFVAIVMHSKVYARLQKRNLITFVPYGAQNIQVPTYLGFAVQVDDTVPVVAGSTSGFKYTSYMFGLGAIGTANGKVKNPVETDRQALTGGGVDILVNRVAYVLHPYGMSFISNTVANNLTPTNAELALAANWSMIYDTKNIPLASMVTNG